MGQFNLNSAHKISNTGSTQFQQKFPSYNSLVVVLVGVARLVIGYCGYENAAIMLLLQCYVKKNKPVDDSTK
jgi:hypothetical protein